MRRTAMTLAAMLACAGCTLPGGSQTSAPPMPSEGTAQPSAGGTTQPTAMGDKTALNLGVGIGLGADYMLNRRWALGAEVRYHAFLTDLGRLPLYLTVGPRLLVRFGL